MARTTLDLDVGVLADLRRLSKRSGKSMGQLASELLKKGLSTASTAEEPPFEWTARDLGPPIVDLEDKEAVRRALGEGL